MLNFFLNSRFTSKFGTHGATGSRSFAVVANAAFLFTDRRSRLDCGDITKEYELTRIIVFTLTG